MSPKVAAVVPPESHETAWEARVRSRVRMECSDVSGFVYVQRRVCLLHSPRYPHMWASDLVSVG